MESAKKCLLDSAIKRAYDESLRGGRVVQPLKDGPIAAASQRSLQPWEEALAESASSGHLSGIPPAFPSGGTEVAGLYHKWLGIPVSEQPANHYRLLGIADLESDPDVIASAADRQMAHVRTFQIGQHAATSQRILNEIAGARLCLLNEKRKSEYDNALRTRLASQALAIPANPNAPRRTDSKTRLIVACVAGGCVTAAAVVVGIASIFNRTEPAVPADAMSKAEPEVVIQRPAAIPTQSTPRQQERVVDQNSGNAAFGGYSGFGGSVAASPPRENREQAIPPAAVGSPAEASDGDARTQWINDSYNITLRHLEGKRWAEFDKTGKAWGQYEETGRTKDYIELFRPDRRQKQRVLSERMELFQNGKWEWVANGRWAAAQQETAPTTSLQTINPPPTETFSDAIERAEKSVARIKAMERGLTGAGSASSPAPATPSSPIFTLPRKRENESPSIRNPDEQIVMPSGRVVDIKRDFLDELNQRLSSGTFFPSGRIVANLNYDSGKPFAHASQERGTLQGPTLALFETGKPAFVAVYVDGSLNATLLTWNDEGQRSLFGHYRKGEKDGVFCFFGANDKLWLIQEYKLGKLQSSQIVEDNVIVKSFGADSSAAKDPMLVTATSEFDSTLSKFKECERKLKKAVADWDEKRRRALAAENSFAARQKIMDRESTRRANSGSVIGVLREASGLGP